MCPSHIIIVYNTILIYLHTPHGVSTNLPQSSGQMVKWCRGRRCRLQGTLQRTLLDNSKPWCAGNLFFFIKRITASTDRLCTKSVFIHLCALCSSVLNKVQFSGIWPQFPPSSLYETSELWHQMQQNLTVLTGIVCQLWEAHYHQEWIKVWSYRMSCTNL